MIVFFDTYIIEMAVVMIVFFETHIIEMTVVMIVLYDVALLESRKHSPYSLATPQS